MNINRRSILLAAGGAAVLAGCTESSASNKLSIPSSQNLSYEAVDKWGAGKRFGVITSQRKLVVFFDPQCGHCAFQWRESKALLQTASMLWVPVDFMGPISTGLGTQFLNAEDPAAWMDQHAMEVLSKRKTMNAKVVNDSLKRAVTDNTKLLESFNGNGIPYIMGKNLKNDQMIGASGSKPIAAIMANYGWN